MNEATPSSLNPWISKDTILFGKAKNHLADCKWLKVCGLDVTITWQPCNKNKNILNIFTEKIIKYICKKIPWNHLAIKNQLVSTGQIPKALKQLWLHSSLEHLVYLDVLKKWQKIPHIRKLANMIFCQCQHKHRIIHGPFLGKKKLNLKYK